MVEGHYPPRPERSQQNYEVKEEKEFAQFLFHCVHIFELLSYVRRNNYINFNTVAKAVAWSEYHRADCYSALMDGESTGEEVFRCVVSLLQCCLHYRISDLKLDY